MNKILDFISEAVQEGRDAYIEGQPDREKQKELRRKIRAEKGQRKSGFWRKNWQKKSWHLQGRLLRITERRNSGENPSKQKKKDRPL